jgi:hypothetical protein
VTNVSRACGVQPAPHNELDPQNACEVALRAAFSCRRLKPPTATCVGLADPGPRRHPSAGAAAKETGQVEPDGVENGRRRLCRGVAEQRRSRAVGVAERRHSELRLG